MDKELEPLEQFLMKDRQACQLEARGERGHATQKQHDEEQKEQDDRKGSTIGSLCGSKPNQAGHQQDDVIFFMLYSRRGRELYSKEHGDLLQIAWSVRPRCKEGRVYQQKKGGEKKKKWKKMYRRGIQMLQASLTDWPRVLYRNEKQFYSHFQICQSTQVSLIA